MHRYLEDCRQIEELASKIYGHLGGSLEFAPEVRRLFHQLRDDEIFHSRQLSMAQQSSPAELNVLPRITRDQLDEAKKLAEKMYDEVTHRDLSEKEALRIAMTIEETFVKVHVQNVLQFNNAKLGLIFESLGHDDKKHLDTLNDCLKKWEKADGAGKSA